MYRAALLRARPSSINCTSSALLDVQETHDTHVTHETHETHVQRVINGFATGRVCACEHAVRRHAQTVMAELWCQRRLQACRA